MATTIQKSRTKFQRKSRQLLSLALCLLIGATILPSSHSFCSSRWVAPLLSQSKLTTMNESVLGAFSNHDDEPIGKSDNQNSNCRATESRREILSTFLTVGSTAMALTSMPLNAFASPEDDVKETRALIEQAKSQLETVPSLLKEEKWDGVRQVLMEAPLRDCWSKSTPILKKYADALGETPKGDELAALEGREDLLQHLRFLDMAVYNNVFNPIATEGSAGASKTLIDSYYNDPTREFDASMKAMKDLLELSN